MWHGWAWEIGNFLEEENQESCKLKSEVYGMPVYRDGCVQNKTELNDIKESYKKIKRK